MRHLEALCVSPGSFAVLALSRDAHTDHQHSTSTHSTSDFTSGFIAPIRALLSEPYLGDDIESDVAIMRMRSRETFFSCRMCLQCIERLNYGLLCHASVHPTYRSAQVITRDAHMCTKHRATAGAVLYIRGGNSTTLIRQHHGIRNNSTVFVYVHYPH